MNSVKANRIVIYIIVGVSIIKLIAASLLELGNDEVYYWTYGLYPDWSHFDHPPMVGWLVQLFTANLYLKDDFFLRLGPIVLCAISTLVIYRIGIRMKDHLTGLIAVILFSSSIYCNIIAGFALTPDSPEVLFWLISLYLMLLKFDQNQISKRQRMLILLFGLTVGLTILSKYHGVFLWVGAGLFILTCNPQWLKEPSLYLAVIVSILVMSPIVFWNVQNEFITVNFHGARVSPSWEIKPQLFLKELAGQIAYQNPLLLILIIPAVVAVFRGSLLINKNYKLLLLFTSIPLWTLFTGFSLFRKTFPHWTGPAYLSIILIAALYWQNQMTPNSNRNFIPIKIKAPLLLLIALLVLTIYIIRFSPFHFGKTEPLQNFGKNDFTQDMYGWEQIGKEFKYIAEREELDHRMIEGSDLISFKWFPAAHEDFYVAQPSGREVFVIGELSDIHKYAWINSSRGGLKKGNDYYHIAVSNYYLDPNLLFGNYFETIEPMDTIEIKRSDRVMRYAFLYRLKKYNGPLADPRKSITGK